MGPQSTEQRMASSIASTDAYVLHRTPSSSCSDWSDQGDFVDARSHRRRKSSAQSTREAPSAVNIGNEAQGIRVPAFLQPLFGLDFVPYLPSPEKGSIPENNVSDDDDEEDLLILPNINSDAGDTYDDRGHIDDTEAELEDIDESNEQRMTESSGEMEISPEQPTTSITNSPRRKKFFNRNKGENRMLQKAIGKTFNVIQHGRLLKSRDSGEDVERTPRRGTRSAVPRTALSSLSSDVSWSTPSERRANRVAVEQQVQGLRSLEDRARTISQRAAGIESRIVSLTAEAFELQEALSKVLDAIENEAAELDTTERELEKLNSTFQSTAMHLSISLQKLRDGDTTSSSAPKTPTETLPDYLPTERTMIRRRSYTQPDSHNQLTVQEMRSCSFEMLTEELDQESGHAPRRRANTDPQPPTATLPSSTQFMRVGDLELESSSSLSSSFHALDDALQRRLMSGSDDLFLLGENIPLILCRLADLGLQVSSDESSRFVPVHDTQRIIQTKHSLKQDGLPDWPFKPWHVATDKDVLVWTGGVHHKGFGHDWPVVKARCIVRTSSRNLLEFLMDSEQLKRYNKMSQGRENVYVLQEGVDTPAEKSAFGLPGDVRIMRALNKPKLLPKTIEMLSLWYTKPVPDAPDAYMTVSRSVWENSTGTPKNNNNRIRSEMLLGVNLVRPCPEGCEFTTITHVFTPGVPEIMAKRMAPTSAAHMMREIQNIFA